MNKRWWLAIAGLLIGAAGFAQNTSQPPYRPIPPQNYRVAPQRPPMEGARWHKNGLFNPQQFFEQLRNQVRPTRAPNWDRDLTVAPTDDIHPVYFPGQARAFFASNATAVVNGRLANPGPRYRIWRGDMDDGSTPNQGLFTNLTRITGDTPDEQFGSQIQPSLNQQGNILAYANLTASGNYNIVVRNLSTGQRIVLTTDTDGVTQNLRPTLSPGGNLVAFASNRLEPGETEADRRFRIYVMRTDGRPFDDGTIYRRYTFPDPGENDLEPAWSPDGRLIAFARTFPDGSSYIHVVDADTRIVTQWTSFVDGSGNRPQDRQPAWDRTAEGTLVLVFASTRKSLDNQGRHQRGEPSNAVSPENIFDIYAVAADLPEDSGIRTPVSYTVDPSTPAMARPNYPGDPGTFAGAQYPSSAVVARDRVLYQSTRPNAENNEGPHDIWETATRDTTPPVIETLPEIVSGKELFPGDEVVIRVKVVDLQSGVNFVRVQFKDPDSAEQDAEGLEHKLYWLFQFDIFFPNRILADQNQAYVPLFVEIGCQAIHPETYEYKDPYSLASLGFDGRLEDTLLLTPVPNEPDVYEARWRTPDVPSDFYFDIIVRDNAGNEFIYDNISGFTTRRFTGANNILLVSDYMGGQIFVQNRIGEIGTNITRPTWQPVESYWTDNPTGKPPFHFTQPPSGTPLPIIGDGAINHPDFGSPFVWIRADTLGSNTPYGDTYDIWRVQCRNPITPSVLAGYLPRTEQEPVDLEGNYRTKLHAERIVIWGSPYTGNVWAGPGHLLDPEVQTLLQSYLAGGGRLIVSGQDVAWALSLAGGLSSQFLANTLRAGFDSDTAIDTFLQAYQGLRHIIASDGLLGDTTQGEDPNPFPENPAGLGIWPPPLRAGAPGADAPATFRLSHPGFFADGGFDVIPPVGAGTTTPLYTDAAWNQVWLDTVTVSPDKAAPYRYQNRGPGGALGLGTSDRAGSYYYDTNTKAKVAFFAFGIEGVNTHYTPSQLGTIQVLWAHSYRNKILHNGYVWMTHSVVEGVVREYDPDTREYRPLPRALVRITGLFPPSVANQTTGYAVTDSAGFYRIVGLEAGIYLIDAVRPGYRIQHPESVTLAGGTQTINLVMLKSPPGQIAGRVVDINGQPVRYAKVVATNTTDPLLTVETLTDADGSFLLTRVPAGTYNVAVTEVPAAYTLPPVRPTPDGVFRGVQVASLQTTNLPEDFVIAPRPGTVTGTVVDNTTNQPIANARVIATAGNQSRGETFTDENGQYTLSVPAGQYTLTASAPGYQPDGEVVTVVSDQTVTVNFRLNPLPPGSISGRITRKIGGAGEPNVTVEVVFGSSVITSGTTDSDGNYTIPNVPPADYVVRPRKTGFTFEPAQRTVTVTSGQTTANVNFQSSPLRTFVRGRFLVSAPYDYAQDVKSLLEVPQNAVFKFFTWDPQAMRYVFYPNAPANRFELGRGYFIESSVDLPLATEGTPADENVPFSIQLRRGWNLIGTPFRNTVAWERTQVLDPDTNQVISNSTAVGRQLIGNALWGYSFGTYNVTRQMKPWEGYWVYAYRDITLIIPPDAITRSVTGRAALNSVGGWTLTLEAQSGEARDRAYIGVSRAATPGYDSEYDVLKPPPVDANYVYISVPRLEWGAHSGLYGVDIQPVSRSARWEFTVETARPGQEVTLRWPDMAQLPRSANLVLVNLQTGERRYLRTTPSYTFRTDANGVGRFRIEMASSGGLLRVTNLQVASGRGNQHTITFNLTGEATVQVNIMAGGKPVRTLMHQASRSAGLQQVSWDGRDQNGVALPPGSYTVEIRATSEDGQIARAVTTLILTR
ncbi:MAG: carboxypeptidase regulatory-like domain-containing protein [Fimbriimonadales bacterium]|nr:carboxypeptidase regulatory-like domain-containing protein [Fimbriimonadales bacterium]